LLRDLPVHQVWVESRETREMDSQAEPVEKAPLAGASSSQAAFEIITIGDRRLCVRDAEMVYDLCRQWVFNEPASAHPPGALGNDEPADMPPLEKKESRAAPESSGKDAAEANEDLPAQGAQLDRWKRIGKNIRHQAIITRLGYLSRIERAVRHPGE